MKTKAKVNSWQVTAIIFITLFILETLFLGWMIVVGTQEINNENECAYEICYDYESYYYDTYTSVCACYVNGEVVEQVVL